MARFHVETTFEIKARDYFVLCGDVVEGVVRAGMIVHVPLSPATAMTMPIDAVEVVSGVDKKSVGLCIRADETERCLLRGLNIHDEAVDVAEPTP